MIVIIDYGAGNVGSIYNMLKKSGITAKITSDISDIKEADKLILSGVGSFDFGMQRLRKLELVEVLNKKVIDGKTPILGICLGMQLFTRSSEEGTAAGLGWIDAETVKFKFDNNTPALKVPHMGWNFVSVKKESRLFTGMHEGSRFYFVHSYHVKCNSTKDILATARYGFNFTCAINREHVVGVQFHPEKSHKFGMRILTNFAEYY